MSATMPSLPGRLVTPEAMEKVSSGTCVNSLILENNVAIKTTLERSLEFEAFPQTPM